MNTQVLALLIAGGMGIGALGIAAFTVTVLAAFAWRGMGRQQMVVGDARVDVGSIVKMGPYLFACIPLQGAGRWLKNMQQSEYDALGQRVGDKAAYFWMVEKKRAVSMAPAMA